MSSISQKKKKHTPYPRHCTNIMENFILFFFQNFQTDFMSYKQFIKVAKVYTCIYVFIYITYMCVVQQSRLNYEIRIIKLFFFL